MKPDYFFVICTAMAQTKERTITKLRGEKKRS